MASPHACAALVGVLPSLLRMKRTVVGPSGSQAAATLDAVHRLRRPRVSQVAEHLGLDLSTVSRQVAHLRQRGLLETCPDLHDGRSQRLSLTSAGMDALRRYRHQLVDRLVVQLAEWDDDDVETLTGLVARLDGMPDVPTAAPRPRPTSPSPTSPLQLPRTEPALHLQRNS